MPLTPSDVTKIRALIREELAILAAQTIAQPAPAAYEPPKTRPASGPDIYLSDYASAERATGLSQWTLAAIKRASRGQADSPFTGRITTARRLNRWLATHPQFVPTRVQKNRTWHQSESAADA